MTHLGDRLSALIDGELDGAERDRAHAHLASCEQCRTEAAELRALKRKLQHAAARRARRGGHDPAPDRHDRPGRPAATAPRPAGTRRHTGRAGIPAPGSPAPGSAAVTWCSARCRSSSGWARSRSPRAAAARPTPGPRITPPVEMYSVEHAITTGEVPFTGPSAPGVRGPARTRRNREAGSVRAQLPA